MRKKKNIIDIIVNIVIILLAILIIYWIIELLVGGSPDLSQVNFSLIIMTAGILFKVYREVGEIKIGMKHSFIKIKEDIGLIKNDMDLIKKKLKI